MHPLFWPSVKKLEFLGRFGNRMRYWRNGNLEFQFNHNGSTFLGENYLQRLDSQVMNSFHRYIKWQGRFPIYNLYGLVIGIRHALKHFNDNTSLAIKASVFLGTNEESLYDYYATWFPHLFIQVCKWLFNHINLDPSFDVAKRFWKD